MTTWTPVGAPNSAWTAEIPPVRVFDPYVFDNNPIFDTGPASGIWLDKSAPATNWTQE